MTGCSEFSRRRLFQMTGTLVASSFVPRWANAAALGDPRLLVVVLRGGLDGLSAVPAVGDPDLMRMRAEWLQHLGTGHVLPGTGGMFALDPALQHLRGLYDKGEALIVHAAATPYRGRSHFDAQDLMESGLPGHGRLTDGWLNRALTTMPHGMSVRPPEGLATGWGMPLIMTGKAPVMSWKPRLGQPVDRDTEDRLLRMYRASDHPLASALQLGMRTDEILARTVRVGERKGPSAGPKERRATEFLQLAEGAASLMARPDGPRIATLHFDGWDTHASQGSVKGRLPDLLGALDGVIAGLERGLAPVWQDTAIVVLTEFGRTVAINGSLGTDHGTATVAFLMGGAVKGGRVVADWPGVSGKALFEARDLAPTTDIRSILKGVLADHLHIAPGALDSVVFPGSRSVRPVSGLMA